MARKPTGRPTGRPEKEINWEIFEQLCFIQCTRSEIASVLKVDEDTVSARVKKKYGEEFSAVFKRYSESGKSSLRRYQFAMAKKNTTMAIWLGKQWLGQRDGQEITEQEKADLKAFSARQKEVRIASYQEQKA